MLEMVVLDVTKTEHRCGHLVGEGGHGDRGATTVSHFVSSLSEKGRRLVCSALWGRFPTCFPGLDVMLTFCASSSLLAEPLLLTLCPTPDLGALPFQGECAPMRTRPCRIPVYGVPSSPSSASGFLDVERSGAEEGRVHILVEGWERGQWPEA